MAPYRTLALCGTALGLILWLLAGRESEASSEGVKSKLDLPHLLFTPDCDIYRLLGATRNSAKRKAAKAKADLICNPYDSHGYFEWSEATSRTGKWHTFPSLEHPCPSAPDYFELIQTAFADVPPEPEHQPGSERPFPTRQQKKEAAIQQTNFLRNKTLLILGDSVDRNGLFHLSNLMGAGLWPTDYKNASLVGIAEGWDVRGVPHVLDQWQLQFRAYNGFFYGMVCISVLYPSILERWC